MLATNFIYFSLGFSLLWNRMDCPN